MPNSYVNDDGQPNLENDDADFDNDARVAVRYRVGNLLGAFTPPADHAAGFTELCLDLEDVRLIF